MFERLKLSQRIFAAMFLVILFTSVSILLVTNYSFREQYQGFAENLLKNKEREVIAAIDYELDRYPEIANDDNIFLILENSILGIADVHKTDINVFDIRGNLFRSTEPNGYPKRVLPQQVLDSLSRNLEYLEVPVTVGKDKTVLATYRYITNFKGEPVAIINLPYKSDNSFFRDNMYSLLNRFAGVMLFVLIVGGILSWFMAKQITKKIDLIAAKIKQTDVVIHNKPIDYQRKDELRPLVDSYNEMLEKLNHQSNLLALTEREEAWREMAKQVAHEIKNPLTPMRMMIQNYVRKYDPNNPNAKEKLKDLSDTLVTQIDTMSAIAEAFSDFARMPIRKDEEIDAVATIETALEIFQENMVHFDSTVKEFKIHFDRIYLIRVITNLVKNAIQAVPNERKPEVHVILQKMKDQIVIRISDNGVGIPPNLGDKIFEPKFTTTTGGMGLGLAMVKKIVEDYNGVIRYQSEENRGTEFIIKIPYVKSSF
ncbi:MAG: GHKL domain-containing protein [Flavobacteriaceae bacterium]|jgi:signal transduction histidine kinase|nr:GHKL domain-containing protein [Flavobacteriaceae bacterium]